MDLNVNWGLKAEFEMLDDETKIIRLGRQK